MATDCSSIESPQTRAGLALSAQALSATSVESRFILTTKFASSATTKANTYTATITKSATTEQNTATQVMVSNERHTCGRHSVRSSRGWACERDIINNGNMTQPRVACGGEGFPHRRLSYDGITGTM